MQHKSHLALTLAFICQIAVSQNPASPAQRSAAQATPKLKWVELDGKYKIQVPADFTLGRIDPKITSVPALLFQCQSSRPHVNSSGSTTICWRNSHEQGHWKVSGPRKRRPHLRG